MAGCWPPWAPLGVWAIVRAGLCRLLDGDAAAAPVPTSGRSVRGYIQQNSSVVRATLAGGKGMTKNFILGIKAIRCSLAG